MSYFCHKCNKKTGSLYFSYGFWNCKSCDKEYETNPTTTKRKARK